MKGRVIRQKVIRRLAVRTNAATTLYMFGDNIVRTGLGGQAGEMRGEANVIGVPTKWTPSRNEGAYFRDSDLDYIGVELAIKSGFMMAREALDRGFNIIIPTDGLGTGLADLPNRAPKIHAFIENLIKELENDFPES